MNHDDRLFARMMAGALVIIAYVALFHYDQLMP